MAKHKLYDETPEMKRDDEGKMGVKKPEMKGKDKPQLESAAAGLPAHVRHAHERRDMHNRHETEHATHDNMIPGASKEPMHTRHEKEMKDMHTRHETEAGAMGGTAAGPILADVEKGSK